MEEHPAYRRFISMIAGFLDPRTRADEVRIIRADKGLPIGMGMRPGLEQRPATGRMLTDDDD